MVTSSKAVELIKKVIERHYRHLLVSMVGKGMLSRAQINELRNSGHVVPDKPSLMELVYFHNLLNPHGTAGPLSVEDMHAQQSEAKPSGEEMDYAADHVNDSMRNAIEKLKQDVTARIVGYIHNNNQNFKFHQLKNGGNPADSQKLMKEATISKLKQDLRDMSGDVNRDWLRVATTEMSNAIGIGSADRIVAQNKSKPMDEVYVYRIVVNDQALCKWCRRFYLDSDGSPVVYKLSTLLGNGSNYGKKTDAWQPVVGATHPNERCSQVIELKRGWKVLPGGKQTYIGPEAWDEYILNKLRN
jgi:hypothetical protein